MVLAIAEQKHVNPVYGSYFADPFVWEHDGTYYAIGTGAAEAAGQTVGKVFPLLNSRDFLQWHYCSHALLRPDHALGENFWAPAVACANGKFYLYYSVGHGDKDHQLRVATSESPEGPYKDSGKPLLDPAKCPFAIDPHPFQDVDGQWYLFYARDFLDCYQDRAGTGLVAARMKTLTELADEETVILRARADWQRYQSDRLMYGRLWDWHTLEGPCVCKHAGCYYCFYSGGRWETETYGVDYGVAHKVLGPYSDAGNAQGPRVLRTVPNKLLGPGHNSIVLGPDRQTEYLVYHAWDSEMKARQMQIDKVVWTAEGPRCERLLGG